MQIYLFIYFKTPSGQQTTSSVTNKRGGIDCLNATISAPYSAMHYLRIICTFEPSVSEKLHKAKSHSWSGVWMTAMEPSNSWMWMYSVSFCYHKCLIFMIIQPFFKYYSFYLFKIALSINIYPCSLCMFLYLPIN